MRGTFEGKNRPSSERGVHAIAYELFPEVGFVIHTHQVYATALGLAGFQRGSFTGDERVRLGGAAVAGYGLSARRNYRPASAPRWRTGAHTVFMPTTGRSSAGATTKRRRAAGEAARDALPPLLARDAHAGGGPSGSAAGFHAGKVRHAYPNARFVTTDALLTLAALQKPLRAQLDDMAQMIGVKMPCAEPTASSISAALRHSPAVLVPGIGAAVSAEDPGDCEALGLLADKAAISALHVLALGGEG